MLKTHKEFACARKMEELWLHWRCTNQLPLRLWKTSYLPCQASDQLPHRGGLGRVVLVQRAEGLAQQANIADRVVPLHGLVEVRVEGDLLHIPLLAQVDETLPSGVRRVEELLQGVEHEVCGPILRVELVDVVVEV